MVTISELIYLDIVPKILHSNDIEINTTILHTCIL